MVFTAPIPLLDGNPYPTPAPQGAPIVAAAGAFDSWALGLAPIEAGLGQLGLNLAGLEVDRSSAEPALQRAGSALDSNRIGDALEAVDRELAQPNPVGTQVPFSATIPQLPQATTAVTAWQGTIVQWEQAFLGTLLDVILSWGVQPPGQG